MIEALDHINIRTGKLDEMIAWYRDVLGLEQGARPDFDIDGAWMYAGGNPIVHLVKVDKTPDDGDDLRLEHGAFRASGYAGFIETCEKSGTPYRLAPVPGMPIVQVNVRDPDGNHLHIDFDAAEVPGS
jgi:catechol 2,3-dioxygenase-like lactoylglutathione lyase family enzyme